MAIPKIDEHSIAEAIKYIDEHGVPDKNKSTQYVSVSYTHLTLPTKLEV